MKTATKYLSFEHRTNAARKTNIYVFENGVTLETNSLDGGGTVTYPPTSETGPFSFPIRYSGDVFYALRQGLPIPAQCAAW